MSAEIVQSEMFPSRSCLTEPERYILMFVDGGEVCRAQTLYKERLVADLRAARYNFQDAAVIRAAYFGRTFLGKAGESVIAECINEIVDEMEAGP